MFPEINIILQDDAVATFRVFHDRQRAISVNSYARPQLGNRSVRYCAVRDGVDKQLGRMRQVRPRRQFVLNRLCRIRKRLPDDAIRLSVLNAELYAVSENQRTIQCRVWGVLAIDCDIPVFFDEGRRKRCDCRVVGYDIVRYDMAHDVSNIRVLKSVWQGERANPKCVCYDGRSDGNNHRECHGIDFHGIG